jgi:hypothetical protein
MDHSPEPKEITSRFEKLLGALAGSHVDFAVVVGLAVIFNGSPRLALMRIFLSLTRPKTFDVCSNA